MEEQNDHTSLMLKELSEERKRKQINHEDSDDQDIIGDSIKKKTKYNNYNISQLIREVDSELNSFRQMKHNRDPRLL